MGLFLTSSLKSALSRYQRTTANASEPQAREDFASIATIVERIIACLKAHDTEGAQREAAVFSRRVSDSFATQPPEFKPLAELIGKLRRRGA